MIKSLSVKSFKSLEDVTIEFSSINAIVGQNNTGKTSILKAISAVSKIPQSVKIEDAFGNDWLSSAEIVSNGMPGLEVLFDASFEHLNQKFEYSSRCIFPKETEKTIDLISESLNGIQFIANEPRFRKQSQVYSTALDSKLGHFETCLQFINGLKQVEVVQLIPSNLSLVSNFGADFPAGKQNGLNLPGSLKDILLEDRTLFKQLEDLYVGHFPQIAGISLVDNKNSRCTELYFKLKGGGRVPARSMSDGVLMVLGFLAMLYGNSGRKIYLIEELETHFHFSILEKIIKIFREYLENHTDSQIIFTTHSPYLLNYLEPEEVIVVNMNEKYQTEIRKFDKYSKVEKLRHSFGTGDIWALAGEAKIFDELTQNNDKLKGNLKERND